MNEIILTFFFFNTVDFLSSNFTVSVFIFEKCRFGKKVTKQDRTGQVGLEKFEFLRRVGCYSNVLILT